MEEKGTDKIKASILSDKSQIMGFTTSSLPTFQANVFPNTRDLVYAYSLKAIVVLCQKLF